MTDKQFLNNFLAILGILVVATILILIIAVRFSSIHKEVDMAMRAGMEERIKPIGRVHVGSMPETAEAAPQAEAQKAAPAGVMSAKATYDTVCAVCHATGVANAPIPGDKAVWESRLAAGNEALYASVLNGKGAMPAKGGRVDLSDEVIKDAVDYMLEALR